MGEVVPIPIREPGRCTATTRSGARCRNRAVDVSGFCQVHGGGAVEASPVAPSTEEIDELLAFLRRRVTGEYEVDEFGFDPELTETILAPLARLFHKRYFRVEWRGLEHIPRDGAALLVSNHAGTIPMDAVIMKFGLLDQVERHVRLLAADLVFRLPFVGELARKSGNTLACDEDALRLLERGELLGVFPEGYKGVGKLFKDRYKLQRFGRGGFIELGLRAGAPIVPVAIVGSEEIYPLISHARPLARMLKLPYFPVTPLFPWLGPLGMLPLPTKWTIEFRPPIATDGLGEEAWQDSLLVFEMTDRVRDEIQQTLNRNLGARRSLFL